MNHFTLVGMQRYTFWPDWSQVAPRTVGKTLFMHFSSTYNQNWITLARIARNYAAAGLFTQLKWQKCQFKSII